MFTRLRINSSQLLLSLHEIYKNVTCVNFTDSEKLPRITRHYYKTPTTQDERWNLPTCG